MPHAELPPEERDSLLRVFADAFNASNGSNFVFSEETPRSDLSCDYLFSSAGDPSRLLKVQLTRASGDNEIERRRPALIERHISQRIRRVLQERFPNNLWVSVGFDDLPSTTAEVRALGLELEELVCAYARRGGLPRGPGRPLGVFDRDAESEVLPLVRSHCSSVEVRQIDDLGPSVLAWMGDLPDGRIVRPAARVATAVRAKREKLGPSARDLVLLVWLDTFPYDPATDLDEIRSATEGIAEPFREVWIENLWSDGRGQAHRICP